MIKLTWFNHATNFGDTLTPKIFDYFNIPYEYSPDGSVISTGSVARHARPGTYVLGSGIISRNDKLSIEANWIFVRGPYTRNRIISLGGSCPRIYGDPGLLLSQIIDPSKKEFDIGIVPHVVDYDNVKEKYNHYHVIDLKSDDPFKTVKEITKCRYIISSSLHGIICAHSFGIPAAWVKFSDLLKGDGVKFEDYYSSVNLKAEMSTVDDPIFTTGEYDPSNLIDIFRNLENIIC